MITDQQTNTIYFSHMLEQVCPDLYRSISALKEKGYPIISKQVAQKYDTLETQKTILNILFRMFFVGKIFYIFF